MITRLAREDDFDRITELERKRFSSSIAFTKDKLLSYYKRNNKTFFVVCNDADIVQAFVLITPITYKASLQFANNQIKDLSEMDITDIIDEKTYSYKRANNISQYYYLGDIVSEENIDPRYVLILLNKVMEEYIVNVYKAYTTPVSKDGLKTIEVLGFEKVDHKKDDLGSNYEINILDFKRDIMKKKLLKKCLVARHLKNNWGKK